MLRGPRLDGGRQAGQRFRRLPPQLPVPLRAHGARGYSAAMHRGGATTLQCTL